LESLNSKMFKLQNCSDLKKVQIQKKFKLEKCSD
jgi:hypothetical protein